MWRPSRIILSRGALWSCLLGLLGLAAAPQPARAFVPQVGNILLSDADANPYGKSEGAVLIIKYDSDAVQVAADNQGLSDPVAGILGPDGRLYIADATADPLGLGLHRGAVFSMDPKAISPPPSILSASGIFRQPADLLLEPEGTILLLDSDADPNGWGRNNGALLRVDPADGSTRVVAAPSSWIYPRSLTFDTDGDILVVDQVANPMNLPKPAGAIYKVNRLTGAVTVFRALSQPQFISPCAAAVIPSGPHAGDLLVVDKDADPFNHGTAPGAVLRVPRDGGPPVVVVSDKSFVEPIDIICGLRNDFLVLDKVARPDPSVPGAGAVFEFDLGTAQLEHTWTNAWFRTLSGLSQVTGPEFANSHVTWSDRNLQGLIRPGDLFDVTALLLNTGTEDAASVTLTDTLSSMWSYVVGSDSVSTGAATFDPTSSVFSWAGAVPQGDTVTVRFRIKLDSAAPLGSRQTQSVYLVQGPRTTEFDFAAMPQKEFLPGTAIFTDVARGNVPGTFVPMLYEISPPDTFPTTIWHGAPLSQPRDATFLEDGRIAVFDIGRPSSNSDTLAMILAFSLPGDTLMPMLALRKSQGFVTPNSMVLDRDGSLLIIDADANPRQFHSPNNKPGAVFRFRPDTGQLSFVASDSTWRDPLAGTVDRSGTLVLADPGRGFPFNDQPILWELPGEATPSIGLSLPRTMFSTPSGVACDLNNDLYVTDPGERALLKVHRGQSIAYSVATADSALDQPADCAVQPDGSILIADRDANPMHLSPGDHGAVFRWDPTSGHFSVASVYVTMTLPEGPAVFQDADLGWTVVQLRTPHDLDPMVGDTVQIAVNAINTGLGSVGQAEVAVTPSTTLTLEKATASSGTAGLDARSNLASWNGRIAYGDTVRFNVRARVNATAQFGSNAQASILISGGRFGDFVRSASRPIRAYFTQRTMLLTDPKANPGHAPSPTGALFQLGPAGTAPTLIDPMTPLPITAIDWSLGGELLVAIHHPSPPAQVYRLDTALRQLVLVTPGDSTVNPLRNPVDLLHAPNGDLFVVDRDVRGQAPGSRGAIFKIPGESGVPVLVDADSLFRSPTQAAFGPDSLLYVADPLAAGGQAAGKAGALFGLDPKRGKVVSVFTDPALLAPTGVAPFDDSTFVVTDSVNRSSPGHGALYYYKPVPRVLAPLDTVGFFRNPWRTILDSDGELLILDRKAFGPVPGDTTGVVFSLNPSQMVLRYFAYSDSFRSISDLIEKPGPIVGFDHYTVTDLNGPPLHPSDRVQVEAVLHNQGPVNAVALVWSDSLPAESSLLFSTAQASSGTLTNPSSGVLQWSGDLPSHGALTVRYQAQLNPATAQGKTLRFHSTVRGPAVSPVSDAVQVQTYVPLEPGYIYLADRNADPDGNPSTRGAIFKVDDYMGTVTPFVTSTQFRDIRSIALAGYSSEQLLVLDDQVVRGAGMGTGALFVMDPVTHNVLNALGHSTWIAPRQVIAVSPTEALVLDGRADPFNLLTGPGPGAIYTVDLSRNTVTPLFSDTVFKAPVSIALLRTGTLAICDADADPRGYGNQNGAVFGLDLKTNQLSVIDESPDWRSPIAIAADRSGGYYLADQEATPAEVGSAHGSVWKSGGAAGMGLLSVSPFFRMLVDLEVDATGRPFVCDAEADPLGRGNTGAILRLEDGVQGGFVPLATSALFKHPAGFTVYRDPTPVSTLTAQAATVETGIQLGWHAPADEEGVHFLVYRRAATGPNDPGDSSPAGYDLVSGTEEFQGPGPHVFLDAEVASLQWYVYLLAEIDSEGNASYSSPLLARAPDLPRDLTLYPGRPNPFFPSTSLQFVVPAPGGSAELLIYDATGRRVRVLVRGVLAGGRHTAVWDGRDDAGHRLASGLYFSRLSSGGKVRTVRLVLLK